MLEPASTVNITVVNNLCGVAGVWRRWVLQLISCRSRRGVHGRCRGYWRANIESGSPTGVWRIMHRALALQRSTLRSISVRSFGRLGVGCRQSIRSNQITVQSCNSNIVIQQSLLVGGGVGVVVRVAGVGVIINQSNSGRITGWRLAGCYNTAATFNAFGHQQYSNGRPGV